MNIFDSIKQEIVIIVTKLYGSDLNLTNISVELPRERSHGDLATNAALIISKQLNQSPIEIAKSLAKEIEMLDYVSKVEIAGPGFINLSLESVTWNLLLKDIIRLGTNYGDNNLGEGEAINIEFVSCNPTGPMHIGHSRGAIYGDSLANLMSKSGYKVCREFYINDAGAQVDTLAKSSYIRYLQEKDKKEVEIPEGYYPGEYLIAVGEALFKKYGDQLANMNELERLNIIKDFAVSEMMQAIKSDLAMLGVKHDVFFSEKILHEQKLIDKLISQLQEKGVIYRGILPPPKGKASDDWEPREQLLIKSTDFGDDIDRSLQKSSGEWTYAAADIAYMQDKIDRGFKKITMILGIDHSGYKKRMQATVFALAGNNIDFQIKFCSIVNFLKDGQPLKMSKRKGNFITVEDVLSQVDRDIVRFMMLTRRNDQILDFDLEKVKEQSKDNPVFYVQYANARINSIINNAVNNDSDAFAEAIKNDQYNFYLLKREEELSLIKLLASWPKIVELACIHQEPHRIAFYLIELAAEFHGLWSKGNDDQSLRFIIKDNKELSLARLGMAKAVSIVIKSALQIFNVVPVNKM